MLKIKKLNSPILFVCFFIFVVIIAVQLLKSENFEKKEIKTKLITSVHQDLPFEFETKNENIIIVPGEIHTINYTVKNLGDKSLTGLATFQVYPAELKDHITKMNCFCYEEQTLKAGEKEKYALVLLVDPKVTKNIKEAIIQFIFFKK